jgi:branched-chain amino acid transport system ATP-binding protein
MLDVKAIRAGYDSSQVLFDMSFAVQDKQVASLIGRNGMGKSTAIKTIFGLLRARGGSITFDGHDLTSLAPYRIARVGIGLVPESRRIFPSLNVKENLVATARSGADGSRPDSWTLDKVFDQFPRLAERWLQSAATLSGGEQQMLAIGRALMTNPKLLILDEATEGLAPMIRLDIWKCLHRLKDAGLTILVIDKNLKEMADLVDVHHVVERGTVVWRGSPAELAKAPEISERYLGV